MSLKRAKLTLQVCREMKQNSEPRVQENTVRLKRWCLFFIDNICCRALLCMCKEILQHYTATQIFIYLKTLQQDIQAKKQKLRARTEHFCYGDKFCQSSKNRRTCSVSSMKAVLWKRTKENSLHFVGLINAASCKLQSPT